MEMTVMKGLTLKKVLKPQSLALGLSYSVMTTIAFAGIALPNKEVSYLSENMVKTEVRQANDSPSIYLMKAESILQGIDVERDFKDAFTNYNLAMQNRADQTSMVLDYDEPINKLVRSQNFIMSFEEAIEYRKNVKSWFDEACDEHDDMVSCELSPMMKNLDLFFSKHISKVKSKENTSSTISDGSHLRGLPMTRDFILDSYDNFQSFDSTFKQAGSKGSKKIFSIKPTEDTKPRAVILLNRKVFRKEEGSGLPKLDLTISRKNITLCEGFMTLPPATAGTSAESREARKNEVITFLPILGGNANNTLSSPDDCQQALKSNYDYNSAKEELDFILTGFNKGRSPYLAVYESEKSPYSSMILSLGELSPKAIKVLSTDWSELITKVYENGDSIDPVVAMATMLSYDPILQQAQQDSNWTNISIAIRAATCGGAVVAGSVITLGAFMSTPTCMTAIEAAADAMGYEIPSFLTVPGFLNLISKDMTIKNVDNIADKAV